MNKISPLDELKTTDQFEFNTKLSKDQELILSVLKKIMYTSTTFQQTNDLNQIQKLKNMIQYELNQTDVTKKFDTAELLSLDI